MIVVTYFWPTLITKRPVGPAVKCVRPGAGGLRFKSRVVQFGHSVAMARHRCEDYSA